MNTYPLRDQAGQMFAFEIESVYIGIKKVAMLLCSVPGVTDLRVRKLFGSDRDIHIEFTYLGKSFIVWEPYADSSRYWIGPREESQEHIDVNALETALHQYRPLFVTKVLGDLVSFKFLSSIKRWFNTTR